MDIIGRRVPPKRKLFRSRNRCSLQKSHSTARLILNLIKFQETRISITTRMTGRTTRSGSWTLRRPSTKSRRRSHTNRPDLPFGVWAARTRRCGRSLGRAPSPLPWTISATLSTGTMSILWGRAKYFRLSPSRRTAYAISRSGRLATSLTRPTSRYRRHM